MLPTIRPEAESLEPVNTPSTSQSNEEIHETPENTRATSPSMPCCNFQETNTIASKNIPENSKAVSAQTSPSEISLVKEMIPQPRVPRGPPVSLIIMF
ncbi:hypothetical protein TorRG33x02_068390 [Trema orientale]|uniref:Uncharacterized protein n=1 Tax=Trema orientale TaxID=63057 RepID=A0A2P5FHW0_TREOI|nr:hypothetical protein TorRG33x02_068390 [Trema orientale]